MVCCLYFTRVIHQPYLNCLLLRKQVRPSYYSDTSMRCLYKWKCPFPFSSRHLMVKLLIMFDSISFPVTFTVEWIVGNIFTGQIDIVRHQIRGCLLGCGSVWMKNCYPISRTLSQDMMQKHERVTVSNVLNIIHDKLNNYILGKTWLVG